jgi:creatinine amidohydrolase
MDRAAPHSAARPRRFPGRPRGVGHGAWRPAPLVLLLCVSAPALHAQGPAPDSPRPIAERPSLFLEEMTWLEVRDAIASGADIALIATGGIEQNGPYMVTGKHNYVLEAMAPAIARELGNTLIAPILKLVPEGNIDPPSGHMRFPGTFSLRPEIYMEVLTDMAGSLRQHGFRHIVMIGDSGGNQGGMAEVADRLTAEWRDEGVHVHYIPEYYEEDIWSCEYLKELGIHQEPDVCAATRGEHHDDVHYTSIVMTVDPNLVRMEERLAAGLFHINGVDLSPAEETIELGRRLVEFRARLTAEAIRRAIADTH